MYSLPMVSFLRTLLLYALNTPEVSIQQPYLVSDREAIVLALRRQWPHWQAPCWLEPSSAAD